MQIPLIQHLIFAQYHKNEAVICFESQSMLNFSGEEDTDGKGNKFEILRRGEERTISREEKKFREKQKRMTQYMVAKMTQGTMGGRS